MAASQPYNVTQFFEVLGLSQVLAEDAYRDNDARMAHRPTLNAMIYEVTRTRPVDHLIGGQRGCPCGRVMTLAEVFDDPQVQAQEMAIDIVHPSHGTVRVTGFPVKMSGTPCTCSPAPRLGEHGGDGSCASWAIPRRGSPRFWRPTPCAPAPSRLKGEAAEAAEVQKPAPAS